MTGMFIPRQKVNESVAVTHCFIFVLFVFDYIFIFQTIIPDDNTVQLACSLYVN